jgi:hypothetical protein
VVALYVSLYLYHHGRGLNILIVAFSLIVPYIALSAILCLLALICILFRVHMVCIFISLSWW